jgi:hypothetical protein
MSPINTIHQISNYYKQDYNSGMEYKVFKPYATPRNSSEARDKEKNDDHKKMLNTFKERIVKENLRTQEERESILKLIPVGLKSSDSSDRKGQDTTAVPTDDQIMANISNQTDRDIAKAILGPYDLRQTPKIKPWNIDSMKEFVGLLVGREKAKAMTKS